MTLLTTKASDKASDKALDQTLAEETLTEDKPAATVAPTAASSTQPQKISRIRKVARAIARHPRLTQAFLLIALTSGTGLFLLYSLFKGAWSPEQDNLKILHTILKMETSRESTISLDNTDQQVVTRSFQSLDPYVENDDWTWINRFGSTITYGRQEQRLIASCSPYSALYMICSLSEIP